MDEPADDTLLVVAQELLDFPTEYRLRHDHPTMQAILRRLIELLKQEQKRRPPHRPPARVSTGQHVAILIDSDVPPDRAKALTAKMLGLKLSTVERAHRLYRQKGGDK